MASVAATKNTSVAWWCWTVQRKEWLNLRKLTSAHCSGAARRVIAKCLHLVGIDFNNAGYLSKLRQFSLDYNALMLAKPLILDFSVITQPPDDTPFAYRFLPVPILITNLVFPE